MFQSKVATTPVDRQTRSRPASGSTLLTVSSFSGLPFDLFLELATMVWENVKYCNDIKRRILNDFQALNIFRVAIWYLFKVGNRGLKKVKILSPFQEKHYKAVFFNRWVPDFCFGLPKLNFKYNVCRQILFYYILRVGTLQMLRITSQKGFIEPTVTPSNILKK